MKLYYFVVRYHMIEHFGNPISDDVCYAMWRPSQQDKEIEFLLHKTGELSIRINGSLSERFKANLQKLVIENTAALVWSCGFSWAKAEELRLLFEMRDPRYEDALMAD